MTADRRTAAGLAVALTAAAALLFATHNSSVATPPPGGRFGAAAAWPRAARADLPDLLATPLDFLDARTAVGTLPTRDGAYLRLVVESATGAVRELTRLPADAEPQFAAVTAAGRDLVWAQTADRQKWQIWTAPQDAPAPQQTAGAQATAPQAATTSQQTAAAQAAASKQAAASQQAPASGRPAAPQAVAAPQQAAASQRPAVPQKTTAPQQAAAAQAAASEQAVASQPAAASRRPAALQQATAPQQTTAPQQATAPQQTTAPQGTAASQQPTALQGTAAPQQTAAPQGTAASQEAGRARRLVADAGDVLLGGGQYDLVIEAGRVYWATAAEGDQATGIRNVALAGGPVEIREEPGQWALDAWPWLTDEVAGGAGTVRLRNVATGGERRVRVTGGEVGDCTPDWCRVMVLTAGGDLRRVDLMHPDGTARRQIAGPGARSAVDDVAVQGRFEVFEEPDAYSDLTGTAALVVYDLATGRSVLVAPQAGDVSTHDGMLWWSTGQNDLIWHTLDLRTA